MFTPQVKNTIAAVMKDIVVKGSEAPLVLAVVEMLDKNTDFPPNIRNFVQHSLNNVTIKGEVAALIVEAQKALASIPEAPKS